MTEMLKLRVEDNSMMPTFNIGDVVIVDPSVTPRDGDAVVARLEGGCMLLRYYKRRRHGFELLADDPSWDAVPASVAKHAEIVGVMVEHHRRRRTT
jgi:SOS-response transcriptional repressor LexA